MLMFAANLTSAIFLCQVEIAIVILKISLWKQETIWNLLLMENSKVNQR